ncbi:MAG: hypothetical protein Q9188_003424 [Gyalolechia gomerana]
MSRYFPPEHSDTRFPPRDRSPHRFPDRRSSTSYNTTPSSTRAGDANYRSFDANAHPQPPRGPKAYVDPPRGGYPPRGRGYAGRGDFRDRDFHDPRDARGGRDRDWGHRTLIDRRESPPPRRRTRSPQRDYGWGSRDFAVRDLDRDRSRREPIAETPHQVGYRGRGSYRGRGRADWDYVHRGSGGHGDDRDGFRGRGRSQDWGWDRPPRDERDRDRDREQDHESIRHEDPYRRSWEDKDRDVDKYRRDPPFRPDSRNSSATNPSTPHSATGPPPNQLNIDRASHTYRGPGSDSSHRSSGPNSISNYPTPVQRTDAPPSRPDRDRFAQQPPQPPSSPPQAPQVPAFGSISYRPPATIERGATTTNKTGIGNFSTQQASQVPREAIRQPPSAPKAQLLNHATTASRAEQHPERPGASELNPHSNRTSGGDRPPSGPTPAPTTAPSGPKSFSVNSSGDPRPSPQTPTQARRASENVPSKLSEPVSDPPVMTGPTSLRMVHPSRREVIEESGRQETTAPLTGRQTHREISIPGQQSLAKVPTGPRAERAAPSIRQIPPPAPRALSNRLSIPPWGRGQSNLTWVRPGLSQGPPQHPPRGPSIMNTVPTKRDNVGEEKVKTPLPELDDRDPFDSSWPQGGTSLKAALDAAKAEGERPDLGGSNRPAATTTENALSEKKDTPTNDASPQLSSSRNLSHGRTKEGAEDASMDLDEDDYEVAERNFNREMQMLEARRPPILFHHPELLSLVEECNALASAAEDLANGFVPRIAAEKSPTQLPALGLPSPKAEETEKMDMDTDILYDLHRPLIRQQTPPIESLPFLASGPPTPFSQIDDAQHDSSLQEVVRCRIEDNLTAQNKQLDSQSKRIKVYFASCYRSWRLKNIELEEQEKARNDAAPPPTPDNTVSIIGAAIPSISGKNNRVIRNTSDLQMETALKLSEQTAAEEAEKRAHHQAGDRGPNFDKEATVPDMLSEKEMIGSLFNDRNNLISSHTVLEALAFLPKKDNFSAEEHDMFVEYYILNPKRWGTIAELIPGRTYQDCVQHYYLTKGTCAYKEKEKTFLRIKKGRRGPRGSQGRAKSSNLIPLYDGNPENDPGAIAVTETGRPRRTAAPVFGATGDVEASAPASTPLRHNSSRAKVEVNGEPSAEKPRQKGKAALRGGGTRKGRAPLLAAAPGPSPQKGEKDLARGKSREPKTEIEQGAEDLEGAQLLAGLQNSHISTMPVSQHPSVENWMNRQAMMINPTASGLQKVQQPVFEPQYQTQEQRGGQSTTSSYWSVPEHTDFQNLLGYFGTNWQAIADTMKTKSVTMVNPPLLFEDWGSLKLTHCFQQVRNYYNRESQKEGGDFLKQIALLADEKIKRRDDMGPLPAPAVQTKRRNEATPQITAQRTLAPSVDHVELDTEAPQPQVTKPVQVSPSQVQATQPRYPVLAQAEAAPVPVFSQTTSQGLLSNASRPQPSSQQRASQLQGPRSGFFPDERPRPLLQAQPSIDAQKHHQQQRQVHQEDEAHRIRPHEAQSRTEALNRQQKQDFLDKLEQQHHIRHGEPAPQQLLKQPPRHTDQTQAMAQQQPPSRSQSTANSQPFYPPSQHMSSQVRIAPSQAPELEPRPRFSSQPQQSPLDVLKQEPPTAIRRLDPIAQDQGRHPTIHSPSNGRLPLATPPPAENTRPNSVSGLPSQPPPKPAPVQAKRSNIMSILNDEPSEPAPSRRRPGDSFPAPPQPPQQAPVALTQAYQPPSQSSQQVPTRDSGIDKQMHLIQSQHRLPTTQSNVQQQQQQQQVQAWEGPSKWAAVTQARQHDRDVAAAMQRVEQERASVNAIIAKSPHSQPLWGQQLLRGHSRLTERSHAPSPPPAPNSHSRTSSYTDALAQQQMQSQAPKQSSQPPIQAAPNLQPSPYATIQPHQPAAGHPHQQQVAHSQQQARAQQEQLQRQLEEQRHQEMQRRARQEALLQQEAAHQQYQQQQQRPPEAARRPNEQSNSLRPQEAGYGEPERHQERLLQYQVTLMRQEQERRQEQTRREQGRVYTPPIYQSHGYAPPPPPTAQQQRGQGHGR